MIQRLSLDYVFLYVVFAPVAEEVLKSLSLFYVSRRPEFTYFVDGAIYGFAAGIGFSITENFLYISYHPERGIPLVLVRAFSVCLMHGTAAGLVGAAIGRFRFRKRASRGLGLLGGWLTAILLHALFNAVAKVDLVGIGLRIPLQVGIGLAGVGMIALFISMGLREEQAWFAETLDRKMGVTGAEVRAAKAYATIDEVLGPIAEQFPEQAEQVEALVLHQAQLGIKRKVQQQVDDPKLREKLEGEVTRLKEEMEALRDEIGPYIMVYVRSVFPEGLLDIWTRLELVAAQPRASDPQRWQEMFGAEANSAPKRNIFGRLGDESDRSVASGEASR
jgi:hypothetical protein